MRFLNKNGSLSLAARYIELNGCVVKHGPFTGMIYPLNSAMTRHSVPMLIGSYEAQLHPIIEKIRRKKYDLVIDVGSAEGYYAVGLARMLGIEVLSYDPEPIERAYCVEMAKLNNVADKVISKGLFDPTDVAKYAEKIVLMICDCEGFEANLFTKRTVPLTKNWDLLIELHGDATEKVMSQAWPHNATVLKDNRLRETHPEIEGLGDPVVILSENRTLDQTWLWLERESA